MKSKLKFIYQTKTNLKTKNRVLKSKIRRVDNNIGLQKPIRFTKTKKKIENDQIVRSIIKISNKRRDYEKL